MPHRPRPQLPAQVMGPSRGSQRHSPACPRPQELQELQASRNGRLLPPRAKRAGKRPYERVYENIPVSGRQKRRARKQGGRRQPGKCSLVAVWQMWRECWGVGGGEGESEARPGPGWSRLSSPTSHKAHTESHSRSEHLHAFRLADASWAVPGPLLLCHWAFTRCYNENLFHSASS